MRCLCGKVSSGTVKNYSAAAIELIAAIGSAEFTVNISSAGITGFTGASSLNWDDGTPASLPSSVTPGKGGNTAVTFSSVSANGNASQTTTQLTLTFSAAVTGLSASDITLSGISGVTKGTLTGSGPAYTLSISGFTAGGTLSVAVAKTGYNISGSPKQTTIYYSSTNNPEPSEPTEPSEPSEPSEPTPGLSYTLINSNTEYSVSRGTVTSGAVVIAAEYNGLPVTAIDDGAFYNSGITSITIPDSVTSIGEGAFSGCTILSSITTPESVTSIGANAFYNTAIWNNTPDNSIVYVDKWVVGYKGTLSSTISLMAGTKVIGISAFAYCSDITSVTIPSSVTSIGDRAFYNCTSLTSALTIPSSVTSIGKEAFKGCTGLTSVTINSIIGRQMFADCSGLTSVTIGNSVTTIGDYAFNNCSGLTSVIIPNSVISISLGAFNGCIGLTSVTFAAGSQLQSIDDEAFYFCFNLESITIPNSVTSIGDAAFLNCNSFTNVTIPNNVTSIGYMAFAYCSGLTSIIIPNSVTSIGAAAFSSCTGLTSVTIGSGVTSIGNSAFSGCSGLTSITIPNSVTSIGEEAFNCNNLTSVTFQGTIAAANFSSNNSFPEYLRDAYLAGGPGIYTRTSIYSLTWTKQP